MYPDHWIFFTIMTIPLALILWYDRKNIRTYLGIGMLGLALDIVWDPIAMYFGLWYYSSWPQVFGISVYTLIMYIHYFTLCYFCSNRLASAVMKWK